MLYVLEHFSFLIQCDWEKTEYTTRVSYPLPTRRYIPLEAILKTLFPLTGFDQFLMFLCTNGFQLNVGRVRDSCMRKQQAS